MRIYCSAVVLVAVLSGCASTSNAPSMAQGDAMDAADSICSLAALGLVEGQIARVIATYKSDRFHYAYLSNSGCGKEGVLNVGDVEPISEKTLKNFYDSGDLRCAERGTPYICVMEAKIDADVKIVRGQNGEFAAEILKVYDFSFIEPGP